MLAIRILFQGVLGQLYGNGLGHYGRVHAVAGVVLSLARPHRMKLHARSGYAVVECHRRRVSDRAQPRMILFGKDRPAGEIRRDSCLERVCQYVWMLVVAVSLQKTRFARTLTSTRSLLL